MNTEARIKIKNKNFEIKVDLDKALALKKGGSVNPQEVLLIDIIFSDAKKGFIMLTRSLSRSISCNKSGDKM